MYSEPIEIEDCSKLNELFENLRSSGFRRSFLADPSEAVAQVEAGGLPTEFVDALAELSPQELRLVADLANRFRILPGPNACIM
jgi:hypothetical protein